MIWPLLPAIAAYLVVAALVWVFGAGVVGESRVGRKAVPLMAALWPLGAWLVVIVCAIAAFDHMVDRLLEDTFGSDGDDLSTGSGRAEL